MPDSTFVYTEGVGSLRGDTESRRPGSPGLRIGLSSPLEAAASARADVR